MNNTTAAARNTNDTEGSIVAIFDTHEGAEKAVRSLQQAGLDLRRLSIIGKDIQYTENAVGLYPADDKVAVAGASGALWGSLWGVLFGAAFLVLPVSGPFLVMGPLVGLMMSAAAGATVGGLSGVLAGVLANAGIPDDSVVAYQLELSAGRYLVMVQGPAEVVQHARSVLADSGARQVHEHEARARFATRDQVLELLTDDEVSKVSLAETDGQIAEGEEYVDLLHMDRGVRRALAGSTAGGRLARKAVQDETWGRITSLLVPSSAATQPMRGSA
jgi:uncharacterized membrane protein